VIIEIILYGISFFIFFGNIWDFIFLDEKIELCFNFEFILEVVYFHKLIFAY